MGETRIGRWGRLTAVAGALALGLTAALGTSTRASAAPSYGNIDTTQTGSIIIHKHVHQTSTSETATPDGASDISSDPVSGVVFTAYPIASLPLGTASSWDTLSTLTVPATACDTPSLAGQRLGTGLVSAATGDNGQTTISTPVAAYLVCETSSPSTVVDKAQPFVVTVPFPDTAQNGGTSNGWLYDVNVYPKNGVAGVKKSVTSQVELGLGATASFPVTTDIPAIADNASFTHYSVIDPLDSRLADPAVASVTVDGTAVDRSYYTTSVANNYAWVSFTQAGLQWLKTQAGKQVVTTFTGTVSSLGENGIINNTAYLDTGTEVSTTPPGTPETPPTTPPTTPPGTPSNTVTQNWGDVKINKVDSGDSTTGLKDAQFEVYASTDPNAASCTSTAITGSAIPVSGESTFTSDSNGAVNIPGLFVSDSVTAPISATQRCYVVKEIQAPAGYVTPSGDAALTAVTVKTGVTSGYDVTIKNSKEVVPGLPLTGGQGTMVASLLGALLVAGGAGGAVVARRRKQNA